VGQAQDRGFSSRLRFDPAAPVLLLSPHPDDAVIDCWSVLTRSGPVQVVNVFTAPPPPGTPPTVWDRLCGATDPVRLMADRAAEDRAALALAGRTPVNLPFVDLQYRGSGRSPLLRELDSEVCSRLEAASAVLAPACLGTRHDDHRFARRYALRLRSAGLPVTLYADVPYCVEFGWPHWVTGVPRSQRLDVDATWRADLAASGIQDVEPTVVALGEERGRAKLEAMRAYATQFEGLNGGPLGRLENPLIHGYEVFWAVP
jgi:LmbE family N-acetylglucosaminyl deacetylase